MRPTSNYRIGMLLDALIGRADLILERTEFIMTALATLQAAEDHLGQSVTNAIAQNAVIAKQLADALAAKQLDDSDDLIKLANDLNDKSAALDAAFNKAADPTQAAPAPAAPAPAAAGAQAADQGGAQAAPDAPAAS